MSSSGAPNLDWLKHNTIMVLQLYPLLLLEVCLVTMLVIFWPVLQKKGSISSVTAEINGVLKVIETSHTEQLEELWIESDFTLANLTFKKKSIMHWSLRNKWENCHTRLQGMDFFPT